MCTAAARNAKFELQKMSRKIASGRLPFTDGEGSRRLSESDALTAAGKFAGHSALSGRSSRRQDVGVTPPPWNTPRFSCCVVTCAHSDVLRTFDSRGLPGKVSENVSGDFLRRHSRSHIQNSVHV